MLYGISSVIFVANMLGHATTREIPHNDNVMPQSTSREDVEFSDDKENQEAQPGAANIFVYRKDQLPDIVIGYVPDPDVHDDPNDSEEDKFVWYIISSHNFFKLNHNTGKISTRNSPPDGNYSLTFEVRNQDTWTKVDVNVVIRNISEEYIERPVSIGVNVTADELHQSLKTPFRLTTDRKKLDIPQQINDLISKHQDKKEVDLIIRNNNATVMEDIELQVKKENCEVAIMTKVDAKIIVFTNTITIHSDLVLLDYECVSRNIYCSQDESDCAGNSIGFSGDGCAVYPRMKITKSFSLFLEITPNKEEDSIVLFVGARIYTSFNSSADFISLELQKGFPVITVNYKGKLTKMEHKQQLSNGTPHTIHIYLNNSTMHILHMNAPLEISSAYLNVDESFEIAGPLQLGNIATHLTQHHESPNWTNHLTDRGYAGCIKNLTFNRQTYNLQKPKLHKNIDFKCQKRKLATSSNPEMASGSKVPNEVDKIVVIIFFITIVVTLVVVLLWHILCRQTGSYNTKKKEDEHLMKYGSTVQIESTDTENEESSC